MPTATIVIPGKPIAQARPRFFRRGKYVKAYSPQETEAGRTYLEIRQQWKQKPLDCPVVLTITALFPVTKASIKKVAAMLNGETKYGKKPDLDNIIKFYSDVMTGIVWRDDSLVYEILASKGYAQEPQTIIAVWW